MKRYRKLISIIMIIIVLALYSQKVSSYTLQIVERKPIKISVFINDIDDYLSLVKQNLEEIQKENNEKVEFIFYDAKSNQAIQTESIDKVLREGTDLILLNLVNNKDEETMQIIVNMIRERNIPVILFNREPFTTSAIKSYNKALYIGTDGKEAGALQGKILIDEWNTNRKFVDKNNDNIMQYIMLMGERINIEAIQRTKYSVLTINNAGIKTEELGLSICDWNTELARNAIDSLFLRYGDKIEVIIANDDSMAIGAIQALQEHGYNKGDKRKTIPVVGVDAMPEARNLISKGIMLGSVVQDPKALAEALYTVGMNLVYNRNPLDGTQYKFDDTGVSIRIPHAEYIVNYNDTSII